LLGLKENVIVGKKIPAGTGMRKYNDLVVFSEEDYQKRQASKREQEEEMEAID